MQLDDGSLPLLVPMSEVAGRLGVQIGAHYLQADQGGRGVLLGGVPGVPRGKVAVIGAGIVGTAAVRMAVGLGAEVSVLDIDQRKLSHLYDIYHGGIDTLYSNVVNLEQSVLEADIVIGAVLLPGARAPVLVDRDLVAAMKPGSVIVDVAVDQGGCVETIRPTSHSKPIYVEHGVIHYGVPNMPGAVPRTSTLALNNATFPYLLELCRRGVDGALNANPALARGVNCYRGQVTQKGVADALGLPYVHQPWAKRGLIAGLGASGGRAPPALRSASPHARSLALACRTPCRRCRRRPRADRLARGRKRRRRAQRGEAERSPSRSPACGAWLRAGRARSGRRRGTARSRTRAARSPPNDGSGSRRIASRTRRASGPSSAETSDSGSGISIRNVSGAVRATMSNSRSPARSSCASDTTSRSAVASSGPASRSARPSSRKRTSAKLRPRALERAISSSMRSPT